jgi:multisubunit Na+/H+ antiporter MnhF subunit
VQDRLNIYRNINIFLIILILLALILLGTLALILLIFLLYLVGFIQNINIYRVLKNKLRQVRDET